LRNPDFVDKAKLRLPVQKTYKLFIGGKFVCGENGRVLPALGESRPILANSPRGLFRERKPPSPRRSHSISTNAMMRCGKVLKYPKHSPPKIDKHSTGGVGDNPSLLEQAVAIERQ
jgi:hypothetical protein